jgi:hypothetical protein
MKEQRTGPDSVARGSKDQIAHEHSALKESLGRMEKTCDLKVLVPMLQEFRTRLEVHFTREEAPSGFHEIIGETAPHLLAYLQRLFDEHRDLLVEVDRVSEKARVCLEGPLAEVMREVAALSQRIQVHEARETSLLGDAMYTDLGESS